MQNRCCKCGKFLGNRWYILVHPTLGKFLPWRLLEKKYYCEECYGKFKGWR